VKFDPSHGWVPRTAAGLPPVKVLFGMSAAWSLTECVALRWHLPPVYRPPRSLSGEQVARRIFEFVLSGADRVKHLILCSAKLLRSH
jgi:hypothetical protein